MVEKTPNLLENQLGKRLANNMIKQLDADPKRRALSRLKGLNRVSTGFFATASGFQEPNCRGGKAAPR